MTLILKNKDTIQVNEFIFKCCIGKNGKSKKKIEGDKKTPIGIYKMGDLYYRADRHKKPKTNLKILTIRKNFGWCNDSKNIKHEKLFRKDKKYDFLIPIKYNFNKPKSGRGSAIFIHITENYKPTAGCIAISKKDFLIMLKVINKKTKIKIF